MLFGGGAIGQSIVDSNLINISYIVDNNLKGGVYHGIPIHPPEKLINTKDVIVIISALQIYHQEMLNQLHALKIKNKIILHTQFLYEFCQEKIKNKFSIISKIGVGNSGTQKFKITDGQNNYFLRIDVFHNKIENEACLLNILEANNVVAPKVIDKFVTPMGGYVITSFIDGYVLWDKYVKTLFKKDKYEIGLQMGTWLKSLHTIKVSNYNYICMKNYTQQPILEEVYTEKDQTLLKAADILKSNLDYFQCDDKATVFLHGDYHNHNIIMLENTIVPIDFNICGVGNYLYDLSNVIRYLLYHNNKEISQGVYKAYFENKGPSNKEILGMYLELLCKYYNMYVNLRKYTYINNYSLSLHYTRIVKLVNKKTDLLDVATWRIKQI